MLVIGLTGGIASGKSAVAHLFAELGISIIDTDRIAHQLVEPGQPALESIIKHFGPAIVDHEGKLNRQRLREIIFANPSDKQWLESLLHPLIRTATAEQIQHATSGYCIVVIPLLYETWPNPLLNRVLVVNCEPKIQRQRLLLRDDISETLAHTMIAQQANTEERLSIADDVIENNGDLDQLSADVLILHNKYQRLLDSNG